MNLYLQALAEAMDGPKTGYAWLITKDHTADEDDEPGTNANAIGITGPSTATPEDLARLEAGEGDTFEMYDDDGEKYYTGRLVVSGELTHDDEEACSGPLDDYGTPNAGATEIRWPGHPDRNIG